MEEQRGQSNIRDKIGPMPEISRFDLVYFEALNRLGSCRNASMSFGPIPWTAINDYAKSHGMSGGSLIYFIDVVMGLDTVVVDYERKKAEKSNKPKRGK